MSYRRIPRNGQVQPVGALNCQREIAQKIVDQGGDYVLALKGNQGSLHDDVIRYFDDPASKITTAKPVVEGDHGHIQGNCISKHGH